MHLRFDTVSGEVSFLFLLITQGLVKKFDPNLSPYRSLSQAHKSMLRIAQHVNEVKKQRENALRAQDIQSCLSGWSDVSINVDMVHLFIDTFHFTESKCLWTVN